MTHIVKFLSSIRNVQIPKRIAEKKIVEGTTLKDIFVKTLDLEAGFQISEGVSQRRDAEILEMNANSVNDDELNEVGCQSRSPRDVVCWGCGQHGHYQRDYLFKTGNTGANPPIDEGVLGQMQDTLVTTSDVTNKMMGELYKQVAAAKLKGQLYKRGYKKAIANDTDNNYNNSSKHPHPDDSSNSTNPHSHCILQVTTTTAPQSLNPTVQLTRVKRDPNCTSSYVMRAIKVIRGITNAKTYFATTTLKTGDKKPKSTFTLNK